MPSASFRKCGSPGALRGNHHFTDRLSREARPAPVEGLVAALLARGINPLPIYVASLKDETSVNCLRDCFAEQIPSVILNATSFAISAGANGGPDDPLARCDCPVLQVVFAGTTKIHGGKARRALVRAISR